MLPRKCVTMLFCVTLTNSLTGTVAVSADEIHKKHAWVVEAEELTNRLLEITQNRKTKKFPDDYPAMLKLAQERSTVLLRLWEITGAPPICGKEIPHTDSSKNISYYREYIDKHKYLSSEALHKIGLTKCKEALKTRLWLYASNYVMVKASLPKSEFRKTIVHTNPPGMLSLLPLTKESCDRLTKAYSLWLESNKDNFVWDHRLECFRPKSGKYKNTAGLAKALTDTEIDTVETSRAINVWSKKQKEKQQGKKRKRKRKRCQEPF